MSFQVKFGSQSSLTGDGRDAKRSGKGSRSDLHQGQQTESGGHQDHHHRGRGRGRGGRGRGRGGRGHWKQGKGGERAAGDDEEGEDDDESVDSDGGSSISSEGRGRGGYRGGGRERHRGGRGRGGKHGYDQRRDQKGGPRPSSSSEPRSSGDPSSAAQPEVHIHYHSAPSPHQQMPPAPAYAPQQPVPPQPGYQPYPNPGGPPPSAYPYPGNVQPPYPSGTQQPYNPAYPGPAPYREPYPGQAGFSHPAQGPPHFSHPESRPPLLNRPPPPSTMNPQFRGELPHQQPPPPRPQQPYNQKQQQPQAYTSRSAGQERGSRQNLNQKPAPGQKGVSKAQQKEDTKKGGKGPKAAGSETDQQPGNNQDKRGKQDQAQKDEPKGTVPELNPDEWIKIFNLLLKQFNGRAKLGTLMSQKGDLFKGFSHADAAAWLKHDNRFLTLEKDGQVKYVSIYFKEAHLCFKYKKHNTDKCEKDDCPFFHVCKDFVAGNCPWKTSCHFNHSFHTKSNAKVCADVGLQTFPDEEIRIIVLRSTPVVCSKFNKVGCQDDCPDLHICSKYMRTNCSDEGCKFGHSLKESEHNRHILDTFHMQKTHETAIRKIAITMVPDAAVPGDGGKPPSTPADPAVKTAKDKPQDKTSNMKKSRSEERIFDKPELSLPKQRARSRERFLDNTDMALPPSPPQEETDASPGKKRQRKRKPRGGKKEECDADNETSADDLLTDPRAGNDGEGLQFPQRETQRPAHRENQGRVQTQQQRSSAAAKEAEVADAFRAASGEGADGQRPWPASHYTYLCEQYTWTGRCSKGYLCPGFHHRDRPPYVWQLNLFGDWQHFSTEDNVDIEKRFCALDFEEIFEVVLDNIGGLKLSLDFSTFTARVMDTYSSDIGLEQNQALKFRRWSTPSYVESSGSTPFSFYTQWCWYQMNEQGNFQPFHPGTLQYTLEEKYISGQQKYYFEVGENRYLLLLQEMILVDLNQGSPITILRRPIFCPHLESDASAPLMSSLLLNEPPARLYPSLPSHWSCVDSYQDFEMVELDTTGNEYLDVARSFHGTLRKEVVTILRVFRVQNPALWDKYCSTKRSMTPRDRSVDDVDERKLFHGTPALQSVRGICANSMDFRRSGGNVGTLLGKGSYFSAHALYSHSYTRGPDRYMFWAKVLVGKYTTGEQSYTSPPVREGLKLYDSCVDDVSAPTIFVIFDLAQSYPEYLIQYEDAKMASPGPTQTPGVSMATGSGVPSLGTRPPSRGSAAPVSPPVSNAPKPVPAPRTTVGRTPGARADAERAEAPFAAAAPAAYEPRVAAQLSPSPGGLVFQNPYNPSANPSGAGGVDAYPLSYPREAVKSSNAPRSPPPPLQTRAASQKGPPAGKKSDSDKCLIS